MHQQPEARGGEQGRDLAGVGELRLLSGHLAFGPAGYLMVIEVGVRVGAGRVKTENER